MAKILTQKKTVLARVDITGTINSLGIGESVKFGYRQAKSTTVRAAVTRIRQKSKKDFTVTEKDMIGEIMVIRTK
jgi:hypothetical protein